MNILATCCLGDHLKSNFEDVRKAYADVKIVGVDVREMLTNYVGVDKFYRVPRCTDPAYTEEIAKICELEDIDLIVSFSSLDIAPFREHSATIGRPIALDLSKNALIANDKSQFCEFARKNGIKVPITSSTYNTFEEIKCFLGENKLSKIVVKDPLSTGAKGMSILDSSSLDGYSFSGEVIVQEYLPGTEYSADCFCNHGEVLFTAVKKNYDMDLGVSIYSELIESPEIVRICEYACNKLHLDGLVGFDIKENEQGEPLIIECNPRPTATISLVAKAGVNLMAHLIEYFTTGYTKFDEQLEYGWKIARHRQDFYTKEGVWKM